MSLKEWRGPEACANSLSQIPTGTETLGKNGWVRKCYSQNGSVDNGHETERYQATMSALHGCKIEFICVVVPACNVMLLR